MQKSISLWSLASLKKEALDIGTEEMTEHKVTAVDTTIPILLLLLLFCVHRYISDRDSLL